MKRILITVLGAAISLSACAQPPQGPAAAAHADPVKDAPVAQPAAPTGTAPQVVAGSADARAIEAMRALNPNVAIDKVGPAPMPGLREVLVQGQVVYVSDDGGYVFLPGSGGALFNVKGKRNVTEDSLAAMRKGLVKTIPAGERIVFAPANPKYTITVFTDAECGYCRKLHSEIAEYNRQGIAVEYVAYPRMGIGSEDYNKMVSVWCAADRREALTAVKSDRSLPAKTCKNTVAQQYEIGQRAGVGATGTPAIFNVDGFQVGGYVPPAQLRERLDKLAAQAASASGPAAAPAGGV